MSLIRGFLYLISAMILGSFFTVWTIQRRSEIGLQKALGASTGAVLRDALGQVMIVLVVATALGGGDRVRPRPGHRTRRGTVPLGPATVAGAAVILVMSGTLGMLVGRPQGHLRRPDHRPRSGGVSLALDDVCLTFADGDDRVHALDHVTLDVTAGEFVAISGASGSGKSSLLAVAGVLAHPGQRPRDDR